MNVDVPVIEINGEKWFDLKVFDSKFLFRASFIEKPRQKSDSVNQHRYFETIAEGGVKCRPKRWQIIM